MIQIARCGGAQNSAHTLLLVPFKTVTSSSSFLMLQVSQVFMLLAKSGTIEKAGKKPSKRKASSKATTKAIAEVREESMLKPSQQQTGAGVSTACVSVLHLHPPAIPSQSKSTISIAPTTVVAPMQSLACIKAVTSSEASNPMVNIPQSSFANSPVNFQYNSSPSPITSISSPLAHTSVSSSVVMVVYIPMPRMCREDIERC